MIEPNYDDHCWLNAGGNYMEIVAIRGMENVICLDENGFIHHLDLSKLRIDEYVAKAIPLIGKTRIAQ